MLRPIEAAAFFRLFLAYAQSGFLPDDIYLLRGVVRLDAELGIIEALTGTKVARDTWDAFVDSTVNGLLTRFFVLGEDGAYHHGGWDKELARAAKSYNARVKGAASANRKMGRVPDGMAETGGAEVSDPVN